MKRILMAFLILTCCNGNAQQIEIKPISVAKSGDNAWRTSQLTIFNNTSHPICILTSLAFARYLMRDTILITPRYDGDSIYYTLDITQEDVDLNYYDVPIYPLILNRSTTFLVYVKIPVLINAKKLPFILSYIDDVSINYCKLFDEYQESNIGWYAKYKIRKSKIQL